MTFEGIKVHLFFTTTKINFTGKIPIFATAMLKERSIKTLPLDGGVQPFHLINTVYAWRGENLHEYLNSYADVLAWGDKVGLLKKEEIRQLKGIAAAQPDATEKAYQKIIQARV